MKKTIIYSLVCSIPFMAACTKDFDFTENVKEIFTRSNSADAVIEMSYEVETTTRYLEDNGVLYSDLDIASMTPNRDKQSVTMKVFKNGGVYMEMEKMRFSDPIAIPHQTLPDPTPQVHRVVVSNNTTTIYDQTGKSLASIPIEVPNQIGLVQKITDAGSKFPKEMINQAIATMQGQQFAANLEEFIANSAQNGIIIVNENLENVTLRIPISQVDPQDTNDAVLVIDKRNNRLLACRIYDRDKVQLTTLFGYGPPERPYLNAIKQMAMEQLPSGGEVIAETITRIENLKFKVN